MKFSFQMVLVAFVVTLVHLVILATLSPVGADASSQMSKSESEPLVEDVESFPIVNEIPLSVASDPVEEETDSGEKEPEAVSISRDEQVDAPRPADFVEVSREKSQPIPREESMPTEKNGPYEIRQIAPKPRS